ncbi:MAG: DMT family transporter [Eubacterium sp.]|nr:DMT family transporter [Eubacterium sp.]
MNSKYLSRTPVMILLAMFCCVLWGSAFPCIKIGYRLFEINSNDIYSRILFAGCRFAIAGFMVIVIESIREKRFVAPSHPRMIITLSAYQTIIQYFFFYSGLVNTTGVKSAIITGAGTFLTLFVCGLGFKQEKLNAKKIVGTAIGFLGIIIVNTDGLNPDFSLNGEGFLLVAALSSAFASGFIKKYSADASVVMLSGYQFFFGGIIMAIVGWTFGGRLSFSGLSNVVLLAYMGFISAAAYTIWGLLLKYNDVSKVSTCKFMNPLFGALLSFVFLEESGEIDWRIFVSLALVCVGVLIVNLKNTPATK